MMEKKFARHFLDMVKELIPRHAEQETVFESLRTYQSTQDLEALLSDLRKLLNEPGKLELYEHIRPLVLPKHQVEYSQSTPQTPGIKLRVIRLKRQAGETLGFAVRGGFEHGIGVFVSEVQEGSQAQKRGLRVGDEIVRVNGFTIAEAIHEDVLNLIKSREEIVLKVTHIGMLPIKNNSTDSLSWNYVQTMDSSKALQEVLDKPTEAAKRGSSGPDIKIFINTTGVASIGCGIVSGPAHFPGIYVEKIRPGGLAEEVGLEVGDKIIEVNGTSFHGITHNEAVVTLKSSTQLNMVIKKHVGLPLVQQHKQQRQQRPQPASHFKPTIVSEVPEPAPNVPPPIRTLKETNQIVSNRQDDEDDEELDQEQIIQHHLAMKRGKFMTTVMVEKPGSPPPIDEDPLPPPPPPEVLASMHMDEGEEKVEAITSFSVRSSQNEAAMSDPEDAVMNFDQSEDQENGERTDHDWSDDRAKKPMVFGGKAAILAARQAKNSGPTLLGASSHHGNTNMDSIQDPYSLFPAEVTVGKELCLVSVSLDDNESLGIGVDGGIGTPLADKILVADLYGAAERNGEIDRGDQIMMAAGRSFLDLSAAQATNILREAESANLGSVKLIIAKSGLVNHEDEVTYF